MCIRDRHYTADNNKTFKLKDVEVLVHQSIKNITPQEWKNVVGHTWCILNDTPNWEGMPELRVEELIFRLRDDDSDTEEEETCQDKLSLTDEHEVFLRDCGVYPLV